MGVHPLAGKPAPAELLIDLDALVAAYFDRKPDLEDPNQRVSFGTSGHRGSPLEGSFNEAHILATTQAICDYRKSRGIGGPLFMGRDSHAASGPAQRTALEVLAANGVETILQRDDGLTPTPAISRAIIVHNRGGGVRAVGAASKSPTTQPTGGRSMSAGNTADGIVVTPSHNPPADGGFKYNPPNGGPADTDVTSWIQDRANALLAAGNHDVRRVTYAAALAAPATHQDDLVSPYVQDLEAVLDMEAIRSARLVIGVDPLGGAAVGYWEPIAQQYGLDLTVVNPRVDPTFRFMTVDHDGKIRMDCSSSYAMAGLVALKER